MTQEGKFFTTLGSDSPTYIPGGAEIDGELKVKENKHEQVFFNHEVLAQSKDIASGVAPTGVEGDENLMLLAGSIMEYHVLGTQTILKPSLAATGLDVGFDQDDDDGIELCPGILAANKCVFTVGTDPAFFARLRFSIADVSGTDDCAFGFRLREDYQANIDDYNDMAVLNVISGDITIETILNDATTVSTDTEDNWDDGETHELKVLVDADGVVTYEIDGRSPTTTAAFTFDDGDSVVPFFYFLHSSDLAGAIVLQEFECGYQN